MNTAILVSVASGIIIGLLGLVWASLNKRIDSKVDGDVYQETMIHIQKAVEGINGTATELKHLAEEISNIQNKFMTTKEFEYEIRLHKSECECLKQIKQ